MAEPLKDRFDARMVREIGAMLRSAHPPFPRKKFVAEAVEGLDALELVDRARHVARSMRRHLPDRFEQAAAIVVRSLGPPLASVGGNGMAPFKYLPHVIWVAENGLDHFEASMRAQYELTRRFTAEFSIRAFLERDPSRTLARLAQWARDPDEHVRRLVSEGTRPRLPWAPRLRAFQRDPRPVLRLLDLLKDDPSLYVRRSVANNLNDIGKDHPDLMVAVCRRWMKDAPPARRWIVGHALRWLVKKGHPGALEVLGFEGDRGVEVAGTVRPKRVTRGGSCTVAVEVANTSRRQVSVALDLAVHFVKADGNPRAKVFKGRNLTLAAGERASFEKAISFADLTTRRHYAGRHAIDARVNGRAVPIAHVDVIEPGRPRASGRSRAPR